MKYINNTPDSELHQRINNIRIQAAKIGNLLNKEERNIIRKELYKLEHQERFTRKQRETAIAYLINLANALNNKEKYQHSDHHDLDYFGTRDIEHLYNDEINDYYKPILAKSSFEHNYVEYEIRGDKNKNLTLEQYLSTITPELAQLINEKKNSTQSEQKVQLIITVIFKHVMDPIKKRTFYVKSKNIEMRSGHNTDDILNKLLESFLENYEREENILRNGSDYEFDCVD